MREPGFFRQCIQECVLFLYSSVAVAFAVAAAFYGQTTGELTAAHESNKLPQHCCWQIFDGLILWKIS